jgi:hypothetical protein
MHNDAITKLRAILPLGTPVTAQKELGQDRVFIRARSGT